MLQREQKALEKIQEQERVRFGKEIQAAQKLESDLQLKRNMDARRIEKEETARAKEKIRVKLGESSLFGANCGTFLCLGRASAQHRGCRKSENFFGC